MSQIPLFSWLHLSDIHSGHGSPRYKFDQAQVWNKLRQDVERLLADGIVPWPQALFVTGDLSFSGRKEQFDEIGQRLHELAQRLRLPTSAIFTVPGNHDVQRDVTNSDVRARLLIQGVRSTGNIDELLQSDTEQLLRARFGNYLGFVDTFAPSSTGLFWARPVITSRLRIRVVGLNTALLSSNDEDLGNLSLGLRQVGLLEGGQEQGLTVLLTHHPLEGWLRDARSVKSRLQTLAHVHLFGHVHEPESRVSRAGGGEGWLEICAGSVHSDEPRQGVEPIGHGYSFGAVGIDGSSRVFVDIFPRRWSERHDDFRLDSENADPTRPYTRHYLSRPKAEEVLLPARKRHRVPSGTEAAPQVFDVDDLGPVVEAIDTETSRRLDAVDGFLRSVVDRFRPLFFIDHGSMHHHPFFLDLKATLESLVPGIVLNEQDGVLLRAHTRHAILRTETMHSILLAVSSGKLRDTAREIGGEAALDLIRNVLESGNYIPATARAFVALWDFWDRTGGWGKLSLLDSSQDHSDRDQGLWRVQLSNNFLEVKRSRKKVDPRSQPEEYQKARERDLEVTHELCEFWCGYIHGFLDAALPRIRQLMLASQSTAGRCVFVPAFTQVKTVSHLQACEPISDDDLFEVRFEIEPLSVPILRLMAARKEVTTNARAIVAAAAAFDARKSLGPQYDQIVEGVTDGARRKRLTRMGNEPGLPFESGYGSADEWFDDVNWIIQELSRCR